MSKTLKNILYVFAAASFAKIIGAFTSFLIPRILEPSNFGIWVTLSLIISYAPIFALGTVETLLKQFPRCVGEGNLTGAKIVEDSVFSSIIISASILFIIGLFFQLFIKENSLNLYIPQIRLMIGASAVGLFSAYFLSRFTAHQIFKQYGIIDITRALVTCFFLVSFSWFWGLRGTVAGFFLAEIVTCLVSAVLSFKNCGNFGINFDYRLLWNAVRIGFPITIVWWVLAFQSSVDRLVSSYFLGKTATGYYGLGLSFVALMMQISIAVNKVFYPKISENIGNGLDKQALSKLVIMPAQILSLIIPALMGALTLMLPFIYEIFFPKYMPGILSAQIILLGSFSLCLVGNGSNYLIAYDKQGVLFLFVLISLFFNVLCSIIFVKIGFNIEGVAISTVVAAAILTTLVWKTVLKYLDYSIHKLLKEIVKLYLPFFVVLCLVIIITKLTHYFLLSEINIGIIEISTFIVLYCLIIFLIPPYRELGLKLYRYVRYHTGL
ncbi:MAG: lipopolysaccharide biosynthesis protein [Pelosinus sp.]|nr:lipopolysaccharide biosynthesis protein [Pelosinus sp.]